MFQGICPFLIGYLIYWHTIVHSIPSLSLPNGFCTELFRKEMGRRMEERGREQKGWRKERGRGKEKRKLVLKMP